MSSFINYKIINDNMIKNLDLIIKKNKKIKNNEVKENSIKRVDESLQSLKNKKIYEL